MRLTHEGEPLRLPFALAWWRHRRLPSYAESFVEALAEFTAGRARALAAGTL